MQQVFLANLVFFCHFHLPSAARHPHFFLQHSVPDYFGLTVFLATCLAILSLCYRLLLCKNCISKLLEPFLF